ncbi:hypothetical protein M408DRAFT_20658 [Serendipita vermifera MAFF 305830]|uniref:Uncharacterized protein n=1 Tax=Serendipita vermifera MAFF 305830 TaxID=933852 RepID=A0A0C3B691_SERVB|nr:hypothetical protein M408DRAFT_20658 [Serendipita vermifera MAFF 305830]
MVPAQLPGGPSQHPLWGFFIRLTDSQPGSSYLMHSQLAMISELSTRNFCCAFIRTLSPTDELIQQTTMNTALSAHPAPVLSLQSHTV